MAFSFVVFAGSSLVADRARSSSQWASMRMAYTLVVERLGLLDQLRSFDPVLIGTPPLGIAVEGSDIDVACSSVDHVSFIRTVTALYDGYPGFAVRQRQLQGMQSVVVQFTACEWPIELFCQPVPTRQQWGVRHFHIEQRLLALSPALRPRTRQLKEDGMKTEPAFAHVLGLSGDPYEAMLELECKGDDELLSLASLDGIADQ